MTVKELYKYLHDLIEEGYGDLECCYPDYESMNELEWITTVRVTTDENEEEYCRLS